MLSVLPQWLGWVGVGGVI